MTISYSREVNHKYGFYTYVVTKAQKRINTKEEAKVVGASWGTEMLQFLATLAILHRDELTHMLICTQFFNSSFCKSDYILQPILVQES